MYYKTPTSCQEVLDQCPNCTNGYYKILAEDLTEKYVYCSFVEKCDTAGPWTRVAYLNMSDSNAVCPSGTQKFVNEDVVACGIQGYFGSSTCSVSIMASMTSNYSQICGQVAGFQTGSPDGFLNSDDIDSIYLDGVSITRGSPRQHVWSYVIAIVDNQYEFPGTTNEGKKICPCGNTSIMQVPFFVGNDYYYGCQGQYDTSPFHWNDVDWNGEQCGMLETDCCTTPGEPWFHKVLDAPTMDDIEIRICIDQHTNDENVLLSLYEIYVQ